MNYRHAFHAGNFADVIKHLALVAAILHLRRKEKPFCVIDTHGGSGLYSIAGPEASRSQEAAGGIGRVRDLFARADLPDSLRTFLECVAKEGEDSYPGSPRLAARLLRPQDRLVAIEKHPETTEKLRKNLAEFRHARAIEGDGYARLLPLLPPRERRGLVLIDPPYEEEDEFQRATDLLACAHKRFANGVYLLWFPGKSKANAEAMGGELRTLGIGPAVRLVIDINTARDNADSRLSSAGLVIVNPPYRFEDDVTNAAAFLAPRLGRTMGSPAALSLAKL